jgi:hypothetical protein
MNSAQRRRCRRCISATPCLRQQVNNALVANKLTDIYRRELIEENNRLNIYLKRFLQGLAIAALGVGGTVVIGTPAGALAAIAVPLLQDLLAKWFYPAK